MRLNPNQLTVTYTPSVSSVVPLYSRRYTLSHSDITGELFLSVGMEYDIEKISEMRDEVLAEWKLVNGLIYLHVYVFVGDYETEVIAKRDEIFRKELPLALEAIIYGDRSIYEWHPELINSSIWVHFDSTDPHFNKLEYWGLVRNYMYE